MDDDLFDEIQMECELDRIGNEMVRSFSDSDVKDQVQLVLSIGKRTIEESFRLGEMLVSKKQEKGHGNWLPFLDEIGLGERTARNLMRAFNEKDKFIEGMTYSELIGDIKSADSADMSIKDNSSYQSPPDPYAGWSDDEKILRERWANGQTIVINMDIHKNLVRYASDLQVYKRIDRGTDWGNPFIMDADGTRDEVCDWYADHYLTHKKSLLNKIHTLKGKVLGCHCYPKRCHGNHLKSLADGEV